ncbi:MAG: membrane protein insertase YidC [Rhodobacteraceae bacterium]|nr:membrane protein insertase YidC [Paracoccaceae bacterium]
MDDQNKNLILATALSFLVILVWFVLFPQPEPAPLTPPPPAATAPGTTLAPTPPAAGAGADLPAGPDAAAAEAGDAPRLAIETPRLEGTISLLGGRIDTLLLKDYHTTLAADSPVVQLLRPVGGKDAQYALFGWAPGGTLGFDDVPGPNTLWQAAEGAALTPGTPLVLTWESPAGLRFVRTIAIDDNYLFTVTEEVTNGGAAPVRLAPWGIVARHGLPGDLQNFFILHEGVVRMADGTLGELDYDKVAELPPVAREGAQAEVTEVAANGWIGFTDKYWMTALVPAPGHPFTAVAKYVAGSDIYQTEIRHPAIDVAPGAAARATTHLFAGAKEWDTIRAYQTGMGFDRFVDAIDWGWFFFLTKPIFSVLHWLHRFVGNMGWSILLLTLVIKAVLFPLAYKSYVSMARMKELQPEMEKIKERVAGDRQKLQQEMIALYRTKKVNPAAGCLPILLQIPIFFSLYKVIFVTIELRHAPWIGWVRDLSAPDPSSLFNLFGLLPWAPPAPGSLLALVFIGALPILLGISMWLQQKLNPAPADPTQAMIFAWMPWVFMFMLGSFASGLVLYWITNNMITFTQQYLIMRSHGHRPDIFGNILAGLRRRRPAAK